MSAHRLGDRGIATVEFAMLMPVLLVVALGAIEFGLQASVASALDFGARAAGRTGVTGGGYNPVTQITQRQTSLRNAVLAGSFGWLKDTSQLTIGEKSYNTIAEAQADPAGTDMTKGTPGAGGPTQYVRYRLSYVQPLWVNVKLIKDMIGRDSFTYNSTVLVQNEPYPIVQ